MCVCVCVMEQKIKMQKLEKGNNSIGIIIIFSNFVPLEIVYCKKKKKNMYVCVCVMVQKIIENKNAKEGKENNSRIVLNPVPVGNSVSLEIIYRKKKKKNVYVCERRNSKCKRWKKRIILLKLSQTLYRSKLYIARRKRKMYI